MYIKCNVLINKKKRIQSLSNSTNTKSDALLKIELIILNFSKKVLLKTKEQRK